MLAKIVLNPFFSRQQIQYRIGSDILQSATNIEISNNQFFLTTSQKRANTDIHIQWFASLYNPCI